MSLRIAALAGILSALIGLRVLAQEKPRFAGPTAKGFLLPNGWTITPAGGQVALTDLPLNIIPLADGKHALVATSGYNAARAVAWSTSPSGKVVDTADRPPELVRPGRSTPQRDRSGGRAAAATCCTPSISKGRELIATSRPIPSRAGDPATEDEAEGAGSPTPTSGAA